MVFQTFALFPWLTVLQNVEAGLEALSVCARERRRRALAAIDLRGLDGFENAYPRELSNERRLAIKSILIVTHNIEEAVFMCHRILVLSSNPGRVMAEIRVPFA